MIMHIYRGAEGLMDFIHEYRAEEKTGTIVIEIFTAEHNPYDALDAHDTVAEHRDLDIMVRYHTDMSLFNLAIGAALPRDKVFITPSSTLLYNRIETMLHGTHDEIRVRGAALRALDERIFNIIGAAFDIEPSVLEQKANKKEFALAPVTADFFGIQIITKNLVEPPSKLKIDDDDDDDDD